MSHSDSTTPETQSTVPELTQQAYAELHRLAQQYLHRERPEHTLQPTALVHEAYLRMVGQRDARWAHRTQFLHIASEVMRRILVNHERDRRRIKRGGNAKKHDLARVEPTHVEHTLDLLALDEALDRLARIDDRKVKIVNLRFFAGLSLQETATAIGLSLAHTKREWALTKAWLLRELETMDQA